MRFHCSFYYPPILPFISRHTGPICITPLFPRRSFTLTAFAFDIAIFINVRVKAREVCQGLLNHRFAMLLLPGQVRLS